MIPYYFWTTIAFGPLTIQVWGLFVAIGIMLSLWIIKKRSIQYTMSVELLYDSALWLLVGGFIGARLVHVFLYEPSLYLSAPVEIFKIWHGGLSSFGGFFGAGMGFFLYSKKKKISYEQCYHIANELGFASVFGWMVGRVGCAMIHDHWGIPCNCPFAISTPSGGRLDMALLEIIALIPLAIWLYVYRNSQTCVRTFLPIILTYYGVLRLILDFFRINDVTYLGLTPGQYFAIVLVGLGVYFLKRK